MARQIITNVVDLTAGKTKVQQGADWRRIFEIKERLPDIDAPGEFVEHIVDLSEYQTPVCEFRDTADSLANCPDVVATLCDAQGDANDGSAGMVMLFVARAETEKAGPNDPVKKSGFYDVEVSAIVGGGKQRILSGAWSMDEMWTRT